MTLKLTHISRYPVKGLSPEPLTATNLAPGAGLEHDRRFAIAHGATDFDPATPQWLSKTHFLMLMRNAGLARFDTRFDTNGRIGGRRQYFVCTNHHSQDICPPGGGQSIQLFCLILFQHLRG